MKSIAMAVIVFLTFSAAAFGATDDRERRKIEFMISSVETLPGARFVRNGSEYTGKEAARHLRKKLGIAGNRVRSAEDFIRICASKSLVSGAPYLVKFSDNKEMKSEDFFRKKLKEYNASVPPSNP